MVYIPQHTRCCDINKRDDHCKKFVIVGSHKRSVWFVFIFKTFIQCAWFQASAA